MLDFDVPDDEDEEMEDDDAVGGGDDDEMKAPTLTNETLRRLQKAILEVSMPIEVLYFLELKQPSFATKASVSSRSAKTTHCF